MRVFQLREQSTRDPCLDSSPPTLFLAHFTSLKSFTLAFLFWALPKFIRGIKVKKCQMPKIKMPFFNLFLSAFDNSAFP
jgi:hypothetical protein